MSVVREGLRLFGRTGGGLRQCFRLRVCYRTPARGAREDQGVGGCGGERHSYIRAVLKVQRRRRNNSLKKSIH